MAIKEQILNILESAKGSFVSGEEIAERLSVSRNAIWKSINALKKDGHIIEAVTNKGYCLSEKSNVFTSQSVYANLSPELNKRLKISVLKTVDSTNTELKLMAENGSSEGTILIALEQTAGRGRLGRSFYSPKDTGLYMSILLRPEFSASEALSITACAAVAVSEAIDKITGVETQIKWVNDIYYNGKKVCGILTEASMDFESGGLNYAVLGIGINLCTDNFPEELQNVATSVLSENCDIRATVSANILSNFFEYYNNLSNLSFLSEYQRRSLLTGREITFARGNEIFNGIVTGIDDEMRLCVKFIDGEEIAFSSGEVQLIKGEIIK